MAISKKSLIKEIIDNDIFWVAKSPNKKTWIPLKNGSRAPLFLDSRLFNSYPLISEKLSRYIIQLIRKEKISFDKIMGLPYGGLLFSYGVVSKMRVPCLAIRKEGKKNYSTSGDLLGLRKKGDKILLIEDATATADTAVGFVKKLQKEGLVVKDLITIVDIEKGGRENLAEVGVKLYPIFTWQELYQEFLKLRPSVISARQKKMIHKAVYN